jgi:ATP-dependent Lon protease
MLIHDYSMGEPGVRELEKITKKLLEKIVLKIVE